MEIFDGKRIVNIECRFHPLAKLEVIWERGSLGQVHQEYKCSECYKTLYCVEKWLQLVPSMMEPTPGATCNVLY